MDRHSRASPPPPSIPTGPSIYLYLSIYLSIYLAARLKELGARHSPPKQPRRARAWQGMPTLREQAAARRRRSEADAHESFVEGLLPLLKPCALIGFALLLTQLHGPPDSDHGSHLLHDGARGDLLDASHSHAERHRSATNRSACAVAGANRSLACRAALDETRELVAGADPDPLGHEGNGSLPCPGLQAAMGARTVRPDAAAADRGAVHGRSWTVACGLPPVAAAQPRVYVHRFMDSAHRWQP